MKQTQTSPVNFSYGQKGVVIALFTVNPGKESDLVEEIKGRVKGYKDETSKISRYYLERTGSKPEGSYFDSLYEPLFFFVLGKYDIAMLLLVDDFGIIDKLSFWDIGSTQHFIYGPIPTFMEIEGVEEHPQLVRDDPARVDHQEQVDGKAECDRVENEEQVDEIYDFLRDEGSYPLMSICQLKINSFANIEHGLCLVDEITQEIIRHGNRCNGFEYDEENDKLHIVEQNSCKVLAFHSLSWNEVFFIVLGKNYSDISQYIMDIRVGYPQLDCELEKKLLLANEVDVKDCKTHSFSTTYTTHTIRFDLYKHILDGVEGYDIVDPEEFATTLHPPDTEFMDGEDLKAPADTSDASDNNGEEDRVDWATVYDSLNFPVLPITFTNTKPGHFSRVSEQDCPKYHPLNETAVSGGGVVVQEQHAIKLVMSGKGDYISEVGCPYVNNNGGDKLCGYPIDNMPDCCDGYECTKAEADTFLKQTMLKEALGKIITKRKSFTAPRLNGSYKSGCDIYRSWTELLTPVRIRKEEIRDTHYYTQKMITSAKNGFDTDDIRNLVSTLRGCQYPRSIGSGIIKIFSLYNNCIRDPLTFDLYLELYPFMRTFYHGLKHCIQEYNSPVLRKGKTLEENIIAKTLWIRGAISAIEDAISCRMEASYSRNEILDNNPYYKGGAQDLLSVLNGTNNCFLQFASPVERGSLLSVGNVLEITSSNILGGTKIQCDIHRLFEPEFIVDIIHESGHHLCYVDSAKEMKENFDITKDQFAKDRSQKRPNIEMLTFLEDVFSDLLQLLFGFQGNVELFSKHFWSSYFSRFDTATSHDQKMIKSRVILAARFSIVVGFFDAIPPYLVANGYQGKKPASWHKYIEMKMRQFAGNIQTDPNAEYIRSKLHEIRIRFNRSSSYSDSLREHWARAEDEKELWRTFNKSIESIYKQVSSYYSDVYGCGNSVRDVRNFARVAGDRITTSKIYKKIMDGKPVSYKFDNHGESLYSIKVIGWLIYSYMHYVYEEAIKDGQSRLTQKYFNEGEADLRQNYSIENKLNFEKNSSPLMRFVSSGGYFVTGAEFRGEHFKRRMAILMSIWDLSTKEKRRLVYDLFSGPNDWQYYDTPPEKHDEPGKRYQSASVGSK